MNRQNFFDAIYRFLHLFPAKILSGSPTEGRFLNYY